MATSLFAKRTRKGRVRRSGSSLQSSVVSLQSIVYCVEPGGLTADDRRLLSDVRIDSGQVSVPRDALSPTPPGPEGSNGNGLLRVQWVSGVWLFSPGLSPDFSLPHKIQHRRREVRQVGKD